MFLLSISVVFQQKDFLLKIKKVKFITATYFYAKLFREEV